jgi:flagellin-like protein
MQNENRNEEAVSPVIATILMVAITVVLAGVLYVWASSLAEGNTDGNLALYAFSGEDAQGTPSDGTDDNLIMLTMTQGGDINWASISVKLQVDGGAPVTCDNPGGSGGVCVLEEFGTTTDQVWSVGDGVTIKETGTDLCTASCTIDVTITDTREGKVIDETNGVPAE